MVQKKLCVSDTKEFFTKFEKKIIKNLTFKNIITNIVPSL